MVKLLQEGEGGHTHNKVYYNCKLAATLDHLLGNQKAVSALVTLAIPVHIDNNHWAVVIVHIKNKIIQYYDSRGKGIKDKGKVYVDAVYEYLLAVPVHG